MSELRSSFTREWPVNGMPSSMLKSNQNIITNKTPPGLFIVGRYPLFRTSRGMCLLVAGETFPFYLGIAYNMSSIEDSENSWLLCWQWKNISQNYFHLCFKSFELWHLCKSLIPSAKGLSFTFMQDSVVFLLIPTYSLGGKHHVMGKDLNIYGHSNIFDHELLLLSIIYMINKLGGETLSP